MSSIFSYFNEAGAHAPRIPTTRRTTWRDIDNFNEAGAHAPRILVGMALVMYAIMALQ